MLSRSESVGYWDCPSALSLRHPPSQSRFRELGLGRPRALFGNDDICHCTLGREFYFEANRLVFA